MSFRSVYPKLIYGIYNITSQLCRTASVYLTMPSVSLSDRDNEILWECLFNMLGAGQVFALWYVVIFKHKMFDMYC